MTYRGHVENGVVVFDEPAPLAEGAPVRVEPIEVSQDLKALRDGLLQLAGTVKGLPSDMARRHDHYLHGTPKE